MGFQLKNSSIANGPTTITVSYDNGAGFTTMAAGTLTPPSTTAWTAEAINFKANQHHWHDYLPYRRIRRKE